MRSRAETHILYQPLDRSRVRVSVAVARAAAEYRKNIAAIAFRGRDDFEKRLARRRFRTVMPHFDDVRGERAVDESVVMPAVVAELRRLDEIDEIRLVSLFRVARQHEIALRVRQHHYRRKVVAVRIRRHVDGRIEIERIVVPVAFDMVYLVVERVRDIHFRFMRFAVLGIRFRIRRGDRLAVYLGGLFLDFRVKSVLAGYDPRRDLRTGSPSSPPPPGAGGISSLPPPLRAHCPRRRYGRRRNAS